MSPIQHRIALKPFHTFGIDVYANEFFSFVDDSELINLIQSGSLVDRKVLVLGGGSNFLPLGDVNYLIIHPVKCGVSVVSECDEQVIVEAQAGHVWDDFVAFCVNNSFYGVANLSYIPGHVGAAPVPNVGAYGVEDGDCIETVFAIDLQSGEQLQFTNQQCQFGYRHSIFKDLWKNRVVITKVRFKLSKLPVFHLEYGNIHNEIKNDGEVSLAAVRNAIINIRKSKLPDPEVIGNAGSFFKNPVVALSLAEQLKTSYPTLPWYPVDDKQVKIPAGWLIENAGWKGRTLGNAGVHPLQALVLTNLGGASGNEIIALADAIEADVLAKFNVILEKEVNVILPD